VIVLSGGGGASGRACTDDTRATAKTEAINLVMISSPVVPVAGLGVGGDATGTGLPDEESYKRFHAVLLARYPSKLTDPKMKEPARSDPSGPSSKMGCETDEAYALSAQASPRIARCSPRP